MNFIQYSIAHLRQGTRNPERGDVSSNLVCNLHHFRDNPQQYYDKKTAQSSPREKDGAKGGSEAAQFAQGRSPGEDGSEAAHFTQEESPGLDGSQGTDAFERSIERGALNFNRHQCHAVSGCVSLTKGEGNTIPRKGRHKLKHPREASHELH